MAYFLFFKNYGEKFERFCFILIFAGGVGNLIDRVFQGYVIDYFEFLFIKCLFKHSKSFFHTL